MKDTKEIVLFFEENTRINPLDVANELLSRYSELGNPIILPENNNPKSPLVIFNNNIEFQIQISDYSLNCIVNHNYFEKLSSIIFDLVDAMNEFSLNFVRIGYVSSIFMAPKYIDVCKERYLNLDNLKDIEDFNLAWYKKIKHKYGELNVWERLITDKHDFDDLLMQFDINSPREIKIEFDMKYIKDFIKTSDEYIESRTQF